MQLVAEIRGADSDGNTDPQWQVLLLQGQNIQGILRRDPVFGGGTSLYM